MKADRQSIFRRAHELKREDTSYMFGECLRIAWAEAKGTYILGRDLRQGDHIEVEDYGVEGNHMIAGPLDRVVSTHDKRNGLIIYWKLPIKRACPPWGNPEDLKYQYTECNMYVKPLTLYKLYRAEK